MVSVLFCKYSEYKKELKTEKATIQVSRSMHVLLDHAHVYTCISVVWDLLTLALIIHKPH